MDFSLEILEADESSPVMEFETTGDFYSPDCDHVAMPVPVGGNIEGEDDYACTGDGDCHLIAPMLFTADEVAAGVIDHALRFAINNDDIDDDVFYHPATHGTTAGADGSVPYGARLRLKPDFDMGRIADPDARVIVVALQRHGMFLADGGNIPLMGESDEHSTTKWNDLLEDGSHALFGITPDDFEVVALEGEPIALTFECVRNGK